MDTLFENRHIVDEQFYKEFYSYVYFKNPHAVRANIVFVIFVIFGLLYSTFNDYMRDVMIIVFIGMPLFYWLFRIVLYNRVVKTRQKQGLELNNSKPCETELIVTENTIIAREMGSDHKINIEFSKIKKVINVKSYLMLLTEARIGIMFKKDGFVKGSFEELTEFLKTKGLKVR